MPEGISLNTLRAATIRLFGEDKSKAWWEWFETGHRQWAQEGWRRLDSARERPPCRPPEGG